MNNILSPIKKDCWFQIGTNNGIDNFRKYVYYYKPKKVVLVEANSSLIDDINKNYDIIKKFTEVIIINKTIYTENNKEVSLYIPAENGIYGNPGVQPDREQGNHTYTHGQFSLLPMNDWGEKKHMIEIKSKSITFEMLCQQLNIKNIDFLQIDTEGFDSEIIKSIDLNEIDISVIRYEKWPFKEECFSRYNNENKDKYGLNGMRIVKDKLEKHNYKIYDIKDIDGDDLIAIKIKN